jgi:hypothetical protein
MADMSEYKKCPKCGAFSGDDWRQCKGKCPLPATPHHDADTEAKHGLLRDSRGPLSGR